MIKTPPTLPCVRAAFSYRTKLKRSGEALKQQNPPREEVRWVSLVMEGLLGGEEAIRFDRAGRR